MIPILVTIDANYLFPLKVMLVSLAENNPRQAFRIYLIHDFIEAAALEELCAFGKTLSLEIIPTPAPRELFSGAPVSKRYTQAMYYRLLACHMLPKNLDKILYLDPDILVLNSIKPLAETKLENHLFAAAPHSGYINNLSTRLNRVRLKNTTEYYNSGVLLINLSLARKEIVPAKVFDFIAQNKNTLLLPDQDVLNALYGDRILCIDDSYYNYDARNYKIYLTASRGCKTVDWVLENTVIMHFCGAGKPWNPRYRYRFGVLYKHYMAKLKHLQ